MQIISYPVHYQSVCTNFDFSLFSRISCKPKTILLWRKNHTFARRICNTQITNTLRTLREGILNRLRMRGEHSAKHQRSPTKWVANIPPGVGADSSRPYPCIIKYTYPFHRIRISVSHFVGVFIFAGTINRPLRLLTVCDNVAFTHEIGCEHSARRRGRFIAPVS